MLLDATWKLELCREYEAVVCTITNNIGVHTGTWCHYCAWVQGIDLELKHRHGYLIAAWVVEKNVFTLILVPYEYHTRVPFQV